MENLVVNQLGVFMNYLKLFDQFIVVIWLEHFR